MCERTGSPPHHAAVELGAESLHAPGLWPEYHEGYFAAFVRDPDGTMSKPSALGRVGEYV
jgi:hypothetical protein